MLAFCGPYCHHYIGPYLKHTIECNIGGRYLKCSERARLSLLQHTRQCTWDLCTLFQYHLSYTVTFVSNFFQGESYNELANYKDVHAA